MPAVDRGKFGQPGSAPLMNWHEVPLVFDCEGSRLVGIVAQPEHPLETGVVIVVGGPQYRAGSHRQFTLLARQLAEQGIASLRFDYRGMGDSEGDIRYFEAIDADIRAAVKHLIAQIPHLKQVSLWGLCDAASAALYYAHTDPRVQGLILLNPWAHSQAASARAKIKYYYLNRLMSPAFWIKLFTGKVKVGSSISDFAGSARQASATGAQHEVTPIIDLRYGSPGYIDRMLQGLKQFGGKVELILSGNDLTAQAFEELVRIDRKWQKACSDPRVSVKKLPHATHTFSHRGWRDQVGKWSASFLKSLRN